ncbi:MAG: VWA domain-containing protein [Candidatus Binatia bacterium]
MIGFVEPLAWLFSALYGVLILFYLWERWRRPVQVPSLLLWETTREDTLRLQRFRPDPLFVLQLLLLTCLIAGLARPYVAGGDGTPRPGRRIFVLDTSASMQTREAQHTRFEAARAHALEELHSVHEDEEVMLLTTAPAPAVLLNFTRDHHAVAAALERLAPTDAGGDAALALDFANAVLQRTDIPMELDVFTDSALPARAPPRARVFQTGATDENIGIEGLQIFQGRFQDYRGARAYVWVENFSHREGHGFLSVSLEGQAVTRSGFTLPPRTTKSFVVQGFHGPGRVIAQLEVNDALAVDNVAYGWIRPLQSLRLLLVSPPSPLVDDLRALVAATPALQLSIVAPQEFDVARGPQAELIVFNRCAPPVPPPTNALYVYPPPNNSLCPVVGEAEQVEILDWDARHPVLQSLQPLTALPLQHARILSARAGTEALLWSRVGDREFPLALAGQADGHRLACLGFDLESQRLLRGDNLNLLLLFMNLLGWLAPGGDDVSIMTTGEVVPLDGLPDGSLRIRGPYGDERGLSPGQTTFQPNRVGEYRLRGNGTSRVLMANFFDPGESDIGRSAQPAVLPNVTTAGHALPAPAHEYGTWVYLAACALLLLEWVAARRRWE